MRKAPIKRDWCGFQLQAVLAMFGFRIWFGGDPEFFWLKNQLLVAIAGLFWYKTRLFAAGL